MMSLNHNMMRLGHRLRFLPLVLVGLGLVLSGCQRAQPKRPVTTSKASWPTLDRAPGAYKVGKPYQIGRAWY